jgi:hypothetical protein
MMIKTTHLFFPNGKIAERTLIKVCFAKHFCVLAPLVISAETLITLGAGRVRVSPANAISDFDLCAFRSNFDDFTDACLIELDCTNTTRVINITFVSENHILLQEMEVYST